MMVAESAGQRHPRRRHSSWLSLLVLVSTFRDIAALLRRSRIDPKQRVAVHQQGERAEIEANVPFCGDHFDSAIR
jgi:hypothetical protein